MIVFDIESDGLLDTISKVHCINAIDRATGREYRFTDHEYYQNVDGTTSDVPCPRDGTIKDGLAFLQRAVVLGGHHIIGYDLPAIELVYPGWLPSSYLHNAGIATDDSMILSQIIYPDLKDKDWARIRKGKLKIEDFKHQQPGSHSLFAWGVRLGGAAKTDFKPSDYGHTWKSMPFIQDMDEYCMDDVRANVHLFEHFETKDFSRQSADLEMRVAEIITLQERTGVPFDYKAAEELAADLYKRQYSLEQECREIFAPFYKKKGRAAVAKKNMRRWFDCDYGAHTHPKDPERRGHYEFLVAGAERQPIELVEFNPGSNMHIERCLRMTYGWEPTEFTDTGLAKIDEEILGSLPFPEAQKIADYKMVTKRLSQLAEGKNAWMKMYKDGRIYGRVNQLGTVTGRMSHYKPNLAQVPANRAEYGARCRALFTAEPGRVLVGCDADALELRILAHFLARFDDGDYVETVLNGSKEEGTDIHTRNQNALGLTLRDTAKTWFYAFIYGAGNFKLGTIVMSEWDTDKLTRFYSKFPPGKKRQSKIVAIGKRSRDKLMSSLPAFGSLVERVQKAARRGHLKGLDGRRIPVRALHSAVNALCQSAGGVVMKQALVIMFDEFNHRGLDVLPLLNVHDEVQLSTTKEEAEDAGRIAAESIRLAGEHFEFRCPLAGDYDIGPDWSLTH